MHKARTVHKRIISIPESFSLHFLSSCSKKNCLYICTIHTSAEVEPRLFFDQVPLLRFFYAAPNANVALIQFHHHQFIIHNAIASQPIYLAYMMVTRYGKVASAAVKVKSTQYTSASLIFHIYVSDQQNQKQSTILQDRFCLVHIMMRLA